jgi:hypothetical protein
MVLLLDVSCFHKLPEFEPITNNRGYRKIRYAVFPDVKPIMYTLRCPWATFSRTQWLLELEPAEVLACFWQLACIPWIQASLSKNPLMLASKCHSPNDPEQEQQLSNALNSQVK